MAPGDSDVSRLYKVGRLAVPKGAAEELFDAAFTVEFLEIRQAELIEKVLCCAQSAARPSATRCSERATSFCFRRVSMVP